MGARHLAGRSRAAQAQSWTLEPRSSRGTLLLRFVGPTPTHEMPDLLAALTRHLADAPTHLVFDIRELEGHNSEVRSAFQHWLTEHRSRIAGITVVVKKAATLLEVAASVVKLATGMKIQVRDDLESDASVFHLVG